IGFLLLVSLVLSAGLAAVGKYMTGLMPGMQMVAQFLNLVVSFGIITLLFAMIFKLLPDVKIAWKDVWVGAAFTALLFTIGKFGLGLYLGKSAVSSAYGAAGSLVVVLLWVYWSSQILFFGAELTQVYANEYGTKVVPKEHAVMVIQPEPKELPKGEAIPSQTGTGQNSRPPKSRSKPSFVGALPAFLLVGLALLPKRKSKGIKRFLPKPL
ncbi:MAG: ribonuclease, partial [Verrucomicrobiales bacterium]|nr:ribonuclease [Verrucomicrobiales bacterium]